MSAGEYLTATFERSKAIRESLIAVAEASGDLTNWAAISSPFQVIADNGETETVTVSDAVPLTPGARRYLRIRLTLP